MIKQGEESTTLPDRWLPEPLLQSLAVCIIGDRRRPIRKDTEDADILGEYVQDLHGISGIVGGFGDRLIVPAATVGEQTGTFKAPGDDAEAGGFRLFGVGGGNHLAVLVEGEQHPYRR